MSSNKDNEVKNSEKIEKNKLQHSRKEVISELQQLTEELRELRQTKPSVEYLIQAAEICFEQEEYEMAIDLYQQAEELAKRNNPILTSFLQASIASAYAKLHNFDLATHYYITARYTMVKHLRKNAENPPARTNNPIRPTRLLTLYVVPAFLISFIAIYLGYIGFLEGDASSLPRLMLDISLITIIVYAGAFINLLFGK